eukprot:TRINITY_DN12719_c0_g1_i2.p1 TRINITY_DN12719_c0_g1~~TRINITY_DN12719_c0_g1_i2.p1  ORF type:complete len:155 (+),score=11.22 TRINITY_DN12719_c0_g1_i2:92-556(+)
MGFGTGDRASIVQNAFTPGPGTYFVSEEITENKKEPPPGDGLRQNIQDPTRKENTPGPGAYDPTHSTVWQSTPGYRLGYSGRSQSERNRGIPGPGQYDVRGDLDGSKYSFGLSLKKKGLKKSLFDPGPGSYDIPHSIGVVPKYVYGENSLKIQL